jgi:Bacterial capsule synthesis protein PGA_cap
VSPTPGLRKLATFIAVAAGCCGALSASAQGVTRHKPRHRPKPVTLEWVGDIALSTQRGLPPGGLQQALGPVAAQLRDADLTLGNLEGTLSVGGASKCGGIGGGNCFAFQAPPSTARSLHGLGFDLVNMANNHSFDYGAPGRSQTISALNSAAVAHTGLPGEITVVRSGGRLVAFVGFAPYSSDANLLDIPAAEALVRRARRRASLVVVIIHAGAEGASALHTPHGSEFFVGENRGNPRAFAHAVINAGASLVVGSGPHVIRGVERYRGRMIAYSLGNFVGYHTLAGGGVLSDSAILRVTLGANGRVLAARWISMLLNGGLPRPDPGAASARLMTILSRQDFPSDHFTMGSHGRFVP